MALSVLEGFEGYGSASGADLLAEVKAIWLAPTADTDWMTLVDGVSSGKALKWSDEESTTAIIFPIFSATTTVMGFAYMRASTGSSVVRSLITFFLGDQVQCRISINEFGFLRVYRGLSTVIATASSPLPLGTWCFIEIKLVVDNSAGVFQVRLNGSNVINETSVDTQNRSTPDITSIALWPLRDAVIDDIYIYDDVGGAPTLQGTVVIENCEPTSDDENDWTLSAGSDHYALVNSATIDDATYVSSTIINEVDTWGYSNLNIIDGGILGVLQKTRVTTNDVGVRTVNILCDSGSSLDETSVALTGLDNFESILIVQEVDPNTSTAWSVAGFNAANFGAKVGD